MGLGYVQSLGRPGGNVKEGTRDLKELVNLKAAKSLGLPIPQSIVARADEIIR